MNRELLEAPFAREQIKQKPGKFNQTLDYVEGYAVIQRLNSALDGEWSFTIISHEIREDEVIVLGQLQVGDIVKNQFGSSQVTKNCETKTCVSLADDLKSAATDCLKKCSSLLGVGLYLYGDQTKANGKQPQPDEAGSKPHQAKASSGPGPATPPAKPTGLAGSRLSPKQHRFILNLIKDSGNLSKDDMNAHCRQAYGVVLDHISRVDASALIEALLADQVKPAA